MNTIIRKQNGFALMAMTFAAAMVVAIMIFMANEVYRGSAASRSHAKEQIAAINIMKEIAVMIRRAYDLNVARGGACPSGYTLKTLPASDVPTDICLPTGSDSCFGHPMDPTPDPTDNSRPRICLQGSPNNNRKMIKLTFAPDSTQSPKIWDKFYEDRGWNTQYVRSFIKSLNRNLDPLPRADAQNVTTSPWFPAPATISAGGSYRTQDSDANDVRIYNCAAGSGTLCVSFSVCLRMSGCMDAENVADRFTQTIALDRENLPP